MKRSWRPIEISKDLFVSNKNIFTTFEINKLGK
jgi:hypothetical protein